MAKQTGSPVVVTTDQRGVFFGYAESKEGPTIDLKQGRMAVYWSADLRGVVGLASRGPGPHCKISDASDMRLRGVTAVFDCTPQAVEKWEAAPWA